jgi:hypothetical protein
MEIIDGFAQNDSLKETSLMSRILGIVAIILALSPVPAAAQPQFPKQPSPAAAKDRPYFPDHEPPPYYGPLLKPHSQDAFQREQMKREQQISDIEDWFFKYRWFFYAALAALAALGLGGIGWAIFRRGRTVTSFGKATPM